MSFARAPVRVEIAKDEPRLSVSNLRSIFEAGSTKSQEPIRVPKQRAGSNSGSQTPSRTPPSKVPNVAGRTGSNSGSQTPSRTPPSKVPNVAGRTGSNSGSQTPSRIPPSNVRKPFEMHAALPIPCIACQDNSACVRFSRCSHDPVLCQECLCSLIRYGDLRCPADKCGKSAIYADRKLFEHDRELQIIFDDLLSNQDRPSYKGKAEFVYCCQCGEGRHKGGDQFLSCTKCYSTTCLTHRMEAKKKYYVGSNMYRDFCCEMGELMVARDTEEKRNRYQQLVEDEWYKMSYGKLCPQCSLLIIKERGCSKVVCGQNVDGGNYQSGCGYSFVWEDAERYISELPELAQSVPVYDF